MDEHAPSPSQSEVPSNSTLGIGRLVLGPSVRAYRGKTISLELSKEIGWILSQLMTQTGHDPQEIFVRAILLYKAAVDAELEGKHLAILDSDGEIDQEVTNL